LIFLLHVSLAVRLINSSIFQEPHFRILNSPVMYLFYCQHFTPKSTGWIHHCFIANNLWNLLSFLIESTFRGSTRISTPSVYFKTHISADHNSCFIFLTFMWPCIVTNFFTIKPTDIIISQIYSGTKHVQFRTRINLGN